jgi:hypothetical protein
MRSRALLAGLVAVSFAACTSRELPVHPFRITVLDASGAPYVPPQNGPADRDIGCSGVGARLDANTFTVLNTVSEFGCFQGLLTVHYEPVLADFTVPDFVDGGVVSVTLFYRPESRGPGGEPLPYVVLQLGEGAATRERVRFILSEGDARESQGIPEQLLNVIDVAQEDVPFLQVVVPSLYVEPSDCGDIYRDRLRVGGASDSVVLDFDERTTVQASTANPDLPPWNVAHVASWHRAGSDKTAGSCANRLRSWTQAAAKR